MHSGDRALWEFDGTTWSKPHPSLDPPERDRTALAYDPQRARLLLFGGTDYALVFGDLWRWDGSAWTLDLAPSPGARASWFFVDPLRSRAVSFLGLLVCSPFSGCNYDLRTWEWDGNSWFVRSTRNGPSAPAGVAFAVQRGATGETLYYHWVASASSMEAWTYAPIHSPRFDPYGIACAGSAGTPLLSTRPDEHPWLGEIFDLDLTGVPLSPGGAVLFLGASDSVWAGLPLPFPLGGGCSLYTSVDVTVPGASVAGRASWSMPIPLRVELLGATGFLQGFAFGSSGFALSEGRRLRIGGK